MLAPGVKSYISKLQPVQCTVCTLDKSNAESSFNKIVPDPHTQYLSTGMKLVSYSTLQPIKFTVKGTYGSEVTND
jgi:hypothetical protein